MKMGLLFQMKIYLPNYTSQNRRKELKKVISLTNLKFIDCLNSTKELREWYEKKNLKPGKIIGTGAG